jgi:hypothetical protein
MATMPVLEYLVHQGLLLRYDAELEPDDSPQCVIYVTPDFDQWLTTTLPALPKDRGRNLTPWEQVDALFYDFVIGRPMAYDVERKRLEPQADNVWELKSEDMRIMGWFPLKGVFVAVLGEMRKNLKPFSAYAPFIAQVVAFRNGLALDEPKTTSGVSAHDVL